MSTDLRANLARLLAHDRDARTKIRAGVVDCLHACHAALRSLSAEWYSDAAKELALLDAGCRAVRDVLDPWCEGPPAESGVYAVECEDGTSRPGEWHTTSDEVYWLGVARPHQWPTVAGPDEERRPARCRPLDVSGPPTR